MKRSLLVIAFGISFLVVMTWMGTVLVDAIPRRPTAQVQVAQVGPYQISLEVEPNPPPITQPSTLSIQLSNNKTQQPVVNAHVSAEMVMETMDMRTDRVDAQTQSKGLYVIPIQFAMSGPWQVRVHVQVPGTVAQSTVFEVTAQ
ncbi:MAG TPA: FixH family protein [Ktedonobacteraceae bacterium]|nr:FixH family protein [Ktedonobacteraceae bacterium]